MIESHQQFILRQLLSFVSVSFTILHLYSINVSELFRIHFGTPISISLSISKETSYAHTKGSQSEVIMNLISPILVCLQNVKGKPMKKMISIPPPEIDSQQSTMKDNVNLNNS